VLTVTSHALVLWVHVLSACVWIGGQITILAVLPVVRRTPGMPAAVGRSFQRIAWPAFALLLLTGLFNVWYLQIGWSQLWDTAAGRTLTVKLGMVAASGIATAAHVLHQRRRRLAGVAPSGKAPAILGTIGLLSAFGAALYGVVLHGG
jgi:putative copper export protein